MPIPTVPKSLYPLVPKAAGVPNVLRSGAQLLDTLTLGYLGIGDALADVIGTEPTRWGVFDSNGGKLADYDSVVAIDYRNDSKISDYPVESGGFASYNKVDNPYDVRVTLACGGSDDRRAAFLAAVQSARRALQLFTVLTPDATFQSCNIETLDYTRRITEGANMVYVQLGLREVRQTANAAYSTPRDPSGYDPQSKGQIQILSPDIYDFSGVA